MKLKTYYLVPLSALKHGTNHHEHAIDIQSDEWEAGTQFILVKPMPSIIVADNLAVKIRLGEGRVVAKQTVEKSDALSSSRRPKSDNRLRVPDRQR